MNNPAHDASESGNAPRHPVVLWALENFGRGCDPNALFKTMLESGWGWRDAHAFMAAADAERNASLQISWTPSPQSPLFCKPEGEPGPRVSFFLRDPCIALVEKFVTPEEAAGLIRLGQAKLARSTIVADDSAVGSEVHPGRSSSGAQLTDEHNPLIRVVRQRAADLFGCPVERIEGLQILRYLPGEQYKPHHDCFDPSTPSSQIQLGRGGQRVGTLVLYLNDCVEGGFTTFPQLGIECAPTLGNAVFFSYACDSTQTGDPRLLHAGAPVLRGEKWICTFWMRQGVFG